MTEETPVSNWIQDNLRIIISIGIVILLVFAIYSYSKRNSNSAVVVDDSKIDEIAMTAGEENNEINEIIDEIKDEEKKETLDTTSEAADMPVSKNDAVSENTAPTQPEKTPEPTTELPKSEAPAQVVAETEKPDVAKDQKQSATEVVREVIAAQKKDGVVTVTAVSGDSVTTLARKATAQHIAQNNITNLTPAHKIYIEDYLRRTQSARNIHPGTSLEFSDAAISEAVTKAQGLNSIQLDHLNTYAQHVTGL